MVVAAIASVPCAITSTPFADVASASEIVEGLGTKVGSSGVGDGEGLFATRPYNVGERILQDEALVKVSRRSDCLLDDMRDAFLASGIRPSLLCDSTLYRGAADGSRVAQYKTWSEATRCDGEDVCDQTALMEALLVVSFNAFSSSPGNNLEIVYPVISKTNHSCRPNTWVCVPEDGPGELICVRPIAAGEEITVSYLADWTLGWPVEERRRQCVRNWEFACACPRCRPPGGGDDTRLFTCPDPKCAGRCASRVAPVEKRSLEVDQTEALPPACSELALDSPIDGDHLWRLREVTACDDCGAEPEAALIEQWACGEEDVVELMRGLPASLYSAWAVCDDFVADHPNHCLAGRWKRWLAERTRRDAAESEDVDEKAELLAEAAEHQAAYEKCFQAALGDAVVLPPLGAS
eukprot:TRINITY_DN14426_c0_g1_i1.p1 TRINITY_DN14426_c0_g1~~TRINITY_DN14426_c0_g1_i1.p1  ORF type:complete len:408 (+),score=68.24 TRINITY_DN14426_c0_g1_i1:133-1356(+)